MDKASIERSFFIASLIVKKLKSIINEKELAQLEQWRNSSETNQLLYREMVSPEELQEAIDHYGRLNTETALLRMAEKMNAGEIEKRYKKLKNRLWLSAAAAVFLLLGLWTYWYLGMDSEMTPGHNEQVLNQHDVPPGTQQARLILSNGSILPLTRDKDLSFTEEGGTFVQSNGGTVRFASREKINNLPSLNTVITPRGGEFHVVLSDSSQVWLNAGSSLQFPTAFSSNQRTVALTGEGYFEISKDPNRPFIVTINGETIEVLGTHFNVKVYPEDQGTETTLLEGSVMIKSASGSAKLLPGEQSKSGKNHSIQKARVNVQQVMAWRNKLFWFQDASYEEITREFSRWYNVDFVFEHPISEKFAGILPRDLPISKLLDILEKGGHVHFSWENNKIKISPN